jgi:glycosyltransferase involved in cell wall biosynthesis
LGALGTLTHAAASALRLYGLPRFDVLHIHALAPGLVTPLLAPLRVPIVGYIHGIDWQRAKWNPLARAAIRLGEALLVRRSRALVVVSTALQRHYALHHGLDTVHIPNGMPEVSAGTHRNETIERLGLSRRGYFLTLSRIVPEKRIEDVIRAFRQLQTDKHLVIVGDLNGCPRYAADLKRLAAPDPRIRFVGAFWGSEASDLFHGAHCVVSASELEGLPLAVLEACSHRIPVALSDIPPHREIAARLQTRAGLFSVHNSDDLRRVLSSTLQHTDFFREAAQRGASELATYYDWESAADRTEGLCFKLLAPTR